MKTILQIKGLWVPLITPFYKRQFDKESLIKLIKETEPYVDGFVPCLSSGEGEKMSVELWEDVIQTVAENISKPIAAGILNVSHEKIKELSKKAHKLGCIAVVIPLQGHDSDAQRKFCREISDRSVLPIILYNTEKINIHTLDMLLDINRNQKIIAIKDSSQNQNFFDEMLKSKKEGRINISILQGMENKLLESRGCDGYLISLANVEPKLCREMFNNPSMELNNKIMNKWDTFNLASETWYIGIKDALASRGIITSAELI